MTNIKEIIHLYLGCEVEISHPDAAFTRDTLDADLLSRLESDLAPVSSYYKLRLRRLDSMDEAEAIKLCSLYSPEAFGDYRFSKWVAVKDEANFCYNVTNKNSDMSFSVDLEKMHIKVYEGGNDAYPGIENHTYLTEYLKMGFDVFGLIPSGQAIDKNLKP